MFDDFFDRVEPDDRETFFMRLAFDGKSTKLLNDLDEETLNPVFGTPGWERKFGKTPRY